jgi:hypothetical protein
MTTTTTVTVNMDVGVLADARATAAEHGMSVSAWITWCTRRETMRDALQRHREWCAAVGLTGEAYLQGRAEMLSAAAAELDRLDKAQE